MCVLPKGYRQDVPVLISGKNYTVSGMLITTNDITSLYCHLFNPNIHQGIIDYTGTEARQIFPLMFVMVKFFEELFIPT